MPLSLLPLLCLFSCGPDDDTGGSGSPVDGGTTDGGTTDGGTTDGGTTDGGTTDGGTTDGGTTDGGTTDGGTSAVSVPRGLWVWDTDIPGDKDATSSLLSFARKHGITTLFMAADPVGYGIAGAETRYGHFVDAAHAVDIEVFAMSGYAWFTVPCDAGLPGQPTCWTEGWDLFEACASSTVPFDGIMDDSEPASTGDDSFETDYRQRAEWHLDYLEGLRSRIGSLPLHHAVPSWYDDRAALDLDGTGSARTLDAWIADVVDVTAVMAYRDTTAEITSSSATELAQGPVWLGIENGPHHYEHVTFHDDGEAAMLAVLDELEDALGADPNLTGLMVHSYGGWKSMVADE